jgi:hypothetical protein
VNEPIEEPAGACTSALVPGQIVCHDLDSGRPRPLEHTEPHTGRGPTGSRITWTTQEGTTTK